MKDLTGKVALVTGGGKGVGRHIARSLSERGASVVLNCFHSYDAAKRTKLEIEQATGSRVDVVRASVAKKEQVEHLFAEVDRLHGRLDILVNNAASGSLTAIDDIETEHFTKALDTNLLGSFWCAKAAAGLMRRNGGGSIINVSSIGAGLVPDNYLVVGTSKAAVEALTRHLAAEFASDNIRVNTASCSLIQGDVAELFPRAKELKEVALAVTPLGRIATPEDLVGIVTFLSSDLSRWLTGQVVLADGGLSLANAMLSPPRVPMPFMPDRKDAEVPAPSPEPAVETPSEPVVEAEVALHDPGPEQDQEDEDDPVVVVGMGLVVPGANTPEEYWAQMEQGAERFVEAPADRWSDASFTSDDRSAEDKGYQPKAGFVTGFVPDADLAEEVGQGDVGVEHTTLWLRHSLHQALRSVRRADSDRVVYAVGYTADGSQHLEEATVLAGTTQRMADALGDGDGAEQALAWFRDGLESRLWRGRQDPAGSLPHEVTRNSMAGLLPHDTRVFVVDTACSSSLYAIDMGVNSLRQGDCDLAVCGGAFALAPRGAVLFSKLNGLSVGGAVRSLDRSADGVLFSDGAGIVVLKRLSRARADGDRVLGVVRSIGSSSDGKGKAIYAPSSDGQGRAVRRALAGPGVVVDDLDWVVAHATGTPAGDVAEFTTLRETLPADRPIQVTSNKSLIGHTGWAAGVVSLIETLLALEHSTIPRQHRFVEAPPAFQQGSSALQIPRTPVPWPARPNRPRTASVSGFGFGGTNAHLVVEEYVGQRRAPALPPYDGERVALVAWSAHVPGLDGDGVTQWLSGKAPAPDASFGAHYPMPDFRATRIPPSTMKTLDRCQLMMLACMRQLEDQVGSLVDEHRETTGVLAGHLGPTRNGVLYALRCYLEPLRRLLDDADATIRPALDSAYDRMAADVRSLVPPSNENSFPGMMPNVIPARVANAFDLHGLTMTVDTGFGSTLSAVETAMQFLRAGTLDVALVAGINGNSTAEMASLLGDRLPAGAHIAEGAFMLAFVRESTASARGLTPLAFVGDYRVSDEVPSGPGAVVVGPTARDTTWLGADGAVGILQAVLGDTPESTVACVDPASPVAATVSLQVTKPHADPVVRRHTVTWRPDPARPVRQRSPFLPPDTLVVTDDPALVDRALVGRAVGPDAPIVFSTAPLRDPGPTRVHLAEVTPQGLTEALGRLPRPPRHLRLLCDLAATAPADDLATPPDAVLALHDLLFLALQAGVQDYNRGTVLLGLLGGVRDGVPHPYSGLFTGLVKAARFELPDSLLVALLTSTRDPAIAVAEVETESTADRLLPVALYDGGQRHTMDVRQVDPVPGPAPLGPSSVVLSIGGSRGIGAEALKEIAREGAPTIYVVGSHPLAAPGAAVGPKPDHLREAVRSRPGLSVSEASREYDRLANAEAARDNIAAIGALNSGRVTYLVADVRDGAAVQEIVQRVLDAEGRVDLLLNVAGINRAGWMPGKSLADFRAVRDLKVLAYRNLRRAFAGRRPVLWCNFSSLVGFRGQPGETDYASANDFLITASAPTSRSEPVDEVTIGWNLWRDAGLGADPLMLSLLGRRYRFTPMSSASGVGHLMRELAEPAHAGFMVLMGDDELYELGLRPEQVSAAVPGRALKGDAPARGTFMLGRELSRDQGSVTFERTFSLGTDPYLAEHVVDGVPTLPGTFVAELAAEAASALVPGLMVVGIRDLILRAFLRVQPGRAVTRRIRASVLERGAHDARVAVRVTGDVVAPGGQLLAADRTQYEAVVLLADAHLPSPRWEPWPTADDGPAVPEPYHVPNPAVQLTESFVVTADTRLHRLGRRARSAPNGRAGDLVYRSFLLPALLLDGLLRVGMLDDVGDGYRALNAPTAIARIDLYGSGNDAETAAAHPDVELYSASPARSEGSANIGVEPENRAVAATADGSVLVRIEGVASAVMGYVHPATGRSLDRLHPPARTPDLSPVER